MDKQKANRVLLIVAVFFFLSLFGEKVAMPFMVPFLMAHCDTVDGPVITAAKEALSTGNVNLVLIWVQPKDEDAIRDAFQQTLKVRKLNSDAKAMADMYFFETLVRIHRAGEGAPYDGIKAEESETDPGIELADIAVESDSADELVRRMLKHTETEIRKRFSVLQDKKKLAKTSVKAGREYVEQYVTFLHYIEALHKSMVGESAHDEGRDH